jgi:hypothetical protein
MVLLALVLGAWACGPVVLYNLFLIDRPFGSL